MTTKIAELPLHDVLALEHAARINRSIMVARMFAGAYRWLANIFSSNQDALRFRGGLRLN